jgi:GMP reductase
MRLDEEIKLDFKDVLIRPKRSTLKSRSEVDLQRSFTFKHSGKRFTGVPIVAANMDSVGTLSMARALVPQGLSVALHKHYAVDKLVEFYRGLTPAEQGQVFYSLGILKPDQEKLKVFSERLFADQPGAVLNLCIDVANGYAEAFLDFVRQTRAAYPGCTLMAGNVVTGEMVEELILSGADVVKVGIGGGSVCTTRRMAGVGYPQLSAVIECADAAHGLGGLICSDGGCQVPGDLAKAFGGGADFVMLGGMLAGHDEAEGEVYEKGGQKWLRFYGMSSREAMEKHSGAVAEYRASEGKSVDVRHKGPVAQSLKDILGGVRSACTYVGARQLKELSKRTTFVRVSQQTNPMFDQG